VLEMREINLFALTGIIEECWTKLHPFIYE